MESKTNLGTMVLHYLRDNFSSDVRSLVPLKKGDQSQAFSFISKNHDYVIRIRSEEKAFKKDVYAEKFFGRKSIPIPGTYLLGKLNENLYCSVTNKVAGKILDDFTKDETWSLIPEIIRMLDAIHGVDINETINFGDFEFGEKAWDVSWRSYLLKFVDFFTTNADLRKTGIMPLESGVVQPLLTRYKQAIEFCPEMRCLIHGDFGFDNVFSNGKQITGVIDWELAKYGDFLYDVAWLSFWEERFDYASIFLRHYETARVPTPHFHERLLCYKINFGLGALKFYADSGQSIKYHWLKEKLFRLIK